MQLALSLRKVPTCEEHEYIDSTTHSVANIVAPFIESLKKPMDNLVPLAQIRVPV